MKFWGGGAPENKLLVGKKIGFTQKPTDLKKEQVSIYPKTLSKVFSKSAFTMAEVLITIGIIGVVAAMTIPMLISGYKKSVVVSSLQKNLSLFSQAVQLAEAKYGFTDEWLTCNESSSIECTEEFFNNYLLPELKVIKVCTPEESEICWTDPKSLSGNIGYLEGKSDIIKAITALLGNGSSIFMWAGAQNTQRPHWQIWIDIDGPMKGPALIGGDVFGFMLDYKSSVFNGNLRRKGVSIAGAEYSDEYILRNDSQYGCSKSVSGIYAGRYCGALIQHSGWKVPKDYPVKF